MTAENQESQLLIFQPDGPQGVKLGIEIPDRDTYIKLDEEVGKLPEKERVTIEGMKKAAQKVGLNVVKP